MGKSLNEAAKEILASSAANGTKMPMQKVATPEDLGGEDGTKANMMPKLDAAKGVSKFKKRPADKDNAPEARKGLTKVAEDEEVDDNAEVVGEEEADDGEVVETKRVALKNYIKESPKAEDQETVSEEEIDFSVDLGNLFEGTDLSEEFKQKVATIFESAVEAKFNALASVLGEAFEEAFVEQTEAFQTELSEQVEGYLNHIAESFIEENKEAVELKLRTELAEDFITGLHNLFLEHNINVPAERLDVYEDLVKKYDEMQEELNNVLNQNLALQEELAQERKLSLIARKIDESSMTDVAASKFRTLAEDLEFKSEEDFNKKLDIVIENYFTDTVKNPVKLDEELNNNAGRVVETTPQMDRYASVLGKISKRY